MNDNENIKENENRNENKQRYESQHEQDELLNEKKENEVLIKEVNENKEEENEGQHSETIIDELKDKSENIFFEEESENIINDKSQTMLKTEEENEMEDDIIVNKVMTESNDEKIIIVNDAEREQKTDSGTVSLSEKLQEASNDENTLEKEEGERKLTDIEDLSKESNLEDISDNDVKDNASKISENEESIEAEDQTREGELQKRVQFSLEEDKSSQKLFGNKSLITIENKENCVAKNNVMTEDVENQVSVEIDAPLAILNVNESLVILNNGETEVTENHTIGNEEIMDNSAVKEEALTVKFSEDQGMEVFVNEKYDGSIKNVAEVDLDLKSEVIVELQEALEEVIENESFVILRDEINDTTEEVYGVKINEEHNLKDNKVSNKVNDNESTIIVQNSKENETELYEHESGFLNKPHGTEALTNVDKESNEAAMDEIKEDEIKEDEINRKTELDEERKEILVLDKNHRTVENIIKEKEVTEANYTEIELKTEHLKEKIEIHNENVIIKEEHNEEVASIMEEKVINTGMNDKRKLEKVENLEENRKTETIDDCGIQEEANKNKELIQNETNNMMEASNDFSKISEGIVNAKEENEMIITKKSQINSQDYGKEIIVKDGEIETMKTELVNEDMVNEKELNDEKEIVSKDDEKEKRNRVLLNEEKTIEKDLNDVVEKVHIVSSEEICLISQMKQNYKKENECQGGVENEIIPNNVLENIFEEPLDSPVQQEIEENIKDFIEQQEVQDIENDICERSSERVREDENEKVIEETSNNELISVKNEQLDEAKEANVIEKKLTESSNDLQKSELNEEKLKNEKEIITIEKNNNQKETDELISNEKEINENIKEKNIDFEKGKIANNIEDVIEIEYTDRKETSANLEESNINESHRIKKEERDDLAKSNNVIKEKNQIILSIDNENRDSNTDDTSKIEVKRDDNDAKIGSNEKFQTEIEGQKIEMVQKPKRIERKVSSPIKDSISSIKYSADTKRKASFDFVIRKSSLTKEVKEVKSYSKLEAKVTKRLSLASIDQKIKAPLIHNISDITSGRSIKRLSIDSIKNVTEVNNTPEPVEIKRISKEDINDVIKEEKSKEINDEDIKTLEKESVQISKDKLEHKKHKEFNEATMHTGDELLTNIKRRLSLMTVSNPPESLIFEKNSKVFKRYSSLKEFSVEAKTETLTLMNNEETIENIQNVISLPNDCLQEGLKENQNEKLMDAIIESDNDNVVERNSSKECIEEKVEYEMKEDIDESKNNEKILKVTSTEVDLRGKRMPEVKDITESNSFRKVNFEEQNIDKILVIEKETEMENVEMMVNLDINKNIQEGIKEAINDESKKESNIEEDKVEAIIVSEDPDKRNNDESLSILNVEKETINDTPEESKNVKIIEDKKTWVIESWIHDAEVKDFSEGANKEITDDKNECDVVETKESSTSENINVALRKKISTSSYKAVPVEKYLMTPMTKILPQKNEERRPIERIKKKNIFVLNPDERKPKNKDEKQDDYEIDEKNNEVMQFIKSKNKNEKSRLVKKSEKRNKTAPGDSNGPDSHVSSNELEFKRIKSNIDQLKIKIQKSKKERKEFVPYVFNNLQPYGDTTMYKVASQQSPCFTSEALSRTTAIDLCDPWENYRMDALTLPPIKQSTVFLTTRSQTKSSTKERTTMSSQHISASNQSHSNLRAEQNKSANLSYRSQSHENKSRMSSRKIENDYLQTRTELYRLSLDKLNKTGTSQGQANIRCALFAYLQNTPGSKKALYEVIHHNDRVKINTSLKTVT